MENPEKEISGVIHRLTQSPPLKQRQTVETYFTPNASFIHPFCRTGSWEHSRFLISAIYRWYKILSPRIDLSIHSVAYDKNNLLLYVNISQVFRVWFIPFYCAPVNFVTVLTLEHNQTDGKYYIACQNDLYQTDQFVRFAPFMPGSSLLVYAWHFIATAFCVLGTLFLWPVSFFSELYAYKDNLKGIARRKPSWDDGIELLDREMKSPTDS